MKSLVYRSPFGEIIPGFKVQQTPSHHPLKGSDLCILSYSCFSFMRNNFLLLYDYLYYVFSCFLHSQLNSWSCNPVGPAGPVPLNLQALSLFSDCHRLVTFPGSPPSRGHGMFSVTLPGGILVWNYLYGRLHPQTVFQERVLMKYFRVFQSLHAK